MVYVLSKEGKPLMPTKRHGKVKHMLRRGEAVVVKVKPFTIQLTYETNEYTQPVTLGIDSGYNHIGFSAVTEKEEIISGEVNLLQGVSERLGERRAYRRTRRNRKRYRKPRFDNRKRPNGWLAPSIQHKLDSHIRFVKYLKGIIPISKTVVEVANFDIQKIKNPDIEGKDYQQGEQLGFWNLREYVLYRDNYTCQNPNCKSKTSRLQVHHVGYWKGDMSDRPGNLAALCTDCHIPANHKEKGFLYGWEPKLNNFKAETFMSTVRWRLINLLNCQYTYGYITKYKRIKLELDKTHSNDAFVIAEGVNQKRCEPIFFNQTRRNNRCLEKFYDAKYTDIRNGEVVSGQELFSGRRVRNKNFNSENLRKYRGHKVSKGRRAIRKQRYFYQPNDLVKLDNQMFTVKGTHCKGTRIMLKENGKSVAINKLQPYRFSKGLVAF